MFPIKIAICCIKITTTQLFPPQALVQQPGHRLPQRHHVLKFFAERQVQPALHREPAGVVQMAFPKALLTWGGKAWAHGEWLQFTMVDGWLTELGSYCTPLRSPEDQIWISYDSTVNDRLQLPGPRQMGSRWERSFFICQACRMLYIYIAICKWSRICGLCTHQRYFFLAFTLGFTAFPSVLFSFSCFFLHSMSWRKKQEKENKKDSMPRPFWRSAPAPPPSGLWASPRTLNLVQFHPWVGHTGSDDKAATGFTWRCSPWFSRSSKALAYCLLREGATVNILRAAPTVSTDHHLPPFSSLFPRHPWLFAGDIRIPRLWQAWDALLPQLRMEALGCLEGCCFGLRLGHPWAHELFHRKHPTGPADRDWSCLLLNQAWAI